MVRIKKATPTWFPGIEEDVEAAFVLTSGPADAVGRYHRDVQLVLSHNAVCCRSDAHGDYIVGGVNDAALPGSLALLGGEHRDVGALTVLRAGPLENMMHHMSVIVRSGFISVKK